MSVLDSDASSASTSTTANKVARDQARVQLLTQLRQIGYRFITVTPATHAIVNARPENYEARNLRDIFGWNRPFAAALVSEELLALMHRADLVEPWRGFWRSKIRVSSLDDQLYMHSAYPTTRSDAVFFGPDTYRFVHAVDRHLLDRKTPVRRAVDIGCGAGPGAIAVAAALPDAEVFAIDINHTALHMTQINADALGVSNVFPRYSDLLSNMSGVFDRRIQPRSA